MFDINITYMYMYMYNQQYFKKNLIYIKSTEVEKIKRKIAIASSLALFLNSESKPLIITTLKWYDNPQPFNQKVCFS